MADGTIIRASHILSAILSPRSMGVVSLNIPGAAGGGPISGKNPHDHLVMGLLRAAADAVIVGAGTLRAVSREHIWTA